MHLLTCILLFLTAFTIQESCSNKTKSDDTLQLVGGATRCSGQVQVNQGEWLNICRTNWGEPEGCVVCRQLGCGDLVSPYANYKDRVPSHPVWNERIWCTGNEAILMNCSHSSNTSDIPCPDTYRATVACHQDDLPGAPDDGVRLVGGTTQYEGRVELYYNGEWGTICDDGWDIRDARVICRQLGFGPAVSVGCHYGEGHGAILQSDVNCEGSETSILECEKQGWYPSTRCRHQEDAGVQCGVPNDPDVRVRLTLGSLDIEGRVEAYHNGEWGTVCGNSFTIHEADVVCRQLGYRKALKVYEPGYYRSAELIILDNVQCVGTEEHLEDCRGLKWYPTGADCSVLHTSGIECDINLLPDTVASVKVRLTGGAIESEGQVELYHDGQWGTVCAEGFDVKAANVVCRQLGYYAALYRSSAQPFSDGSRSLLLDNLNCRTGMENNIANCGPLEWYRHDWNNCQPTETAAVACHGSKMESDIEIVVRLSNGTQASNGRVEVYHLGKWGSICGAGLGKNEAQVVCRQLGYKNGAPVKQFGFFGSGPEQVNMWALACTGKEILVEKCLNIEWYENSKHVCDKEQTAGVVCSSGTGGDSKVPGTPVYATALIILLAIIAAVLIATSCYCIFLKHSKRNAAATQMRYAVLDKQDNSTAY